MVKGKFPRKPEYIKILEICRKDFKNFKEDNGEKIIENLDSQIKNTGQFTTPNNKSLVQKDNLERVRKLIQEGKEDFAFSLFFRTFPSCLPHRSRNI